MFRLLALLVSGVACLKSLGLTPTEAEVAEFRNISIQILKLHQQFHKDFRANKYGKVLLDASKKAVDQQGGPLSDFDFGFSSNFSVPRDPPDLSKILHVSEQRSKQTTQDFQQCKSAEAQQAEAANFDKQLRALREKLDSLPEEVRKKLQNKVFRSELQRELSSSLGNVVFLEESELPPTDENVPNDKQPKVTIESNDWWRCTCKPHKWECRPKMICQASEVLEEDRLKDEAMREKAQAATGVKPPAKFEGKLFHEDQLTCMVNNTIECTWSKDCACKLPWKNVPDCRPFSYVAPPFPPPPKKCGTHYWGRLCSMLAMCSCNQQGALACNWPGWVGMLFTIICRFSCECDESQIKCPSDVKIEG